MTRKDKVLDVLRTAGGGWVPGYVIASAMHGGSEGLRRLRELREDGYSIERRAMKGSEAFEYRLIEQGQAKLW